jgi:hypothetical protein
MASKKDTTPSKKKDKYRIRNWRQYNQSLVNRRSILFGSMEKLLKNGTVLRKPVSREDQKSIQISQYVVA